MLAPRHRLRSDRIARHQRIGLWGVFLIGMKQSREMLPWPGDQMGIFPI
jgi:hypothetical protein